MPEFFNTLGSRGRWGLAIGAVAIVLVMVGVGTWLLRTDYQVLFADLKSADAGMMIAELERQKIPYQLADGGATILVDGGVVHATRLKLMGKEMPLHGAAGFELFNSGDFGMTEFAQKINYQRALQGELTRTILSLSEVREARVHLALPEESLFKRPNSKPKAAITLSMKAGQSLRPDQVNGIQRLVAAAVPGVGAQDVTIVDQQGVALTRAAAQEGESDIGSARLELKRDTEKLLARKAMEVLERAFGAGQAMATVDATLNMDQVRVTTEDVIGTPGAGTGASSGVVVREREVLRDVGTPLASPRDAGGRASNSQREIEYQVGRRVEQVITQPGAIRRLHVAAVVQQPLDEQQLEQARALITAAVGGVSERGDTVVVQTLSPFVAPAKVAPQISAQDVPVVAEKKSSVEIAETPSLGMTLMGLAAVLLLAGLAWLGLRKRAKSRGMTPAERQAMAGQLRLWLEDAAEGPSVVPAGAAAGSRLPRSRA